MVLSFIDDGWIILIINIKYLPPTTPNQNINKNVTFIYFEIVVSTILNNVSNSYSEPIPGLVQYTKGDY